MASQLKLDEAYLEICKTWSTLSCAKRKKVGCIIVKDGCIISDGFNGTPKGFNNTCEISLDEHDPNSLLTKQEVLHAESNAITKLAKSNQSSLGATMYITITPCLECAKLIIQSGIDRVVFKDFYKNSDGINLLKKTNITINHYGHGKI